MIYELSPSQQDSVSPSQSDGFSTGISGSSRASLDNLGIKPPSSIELQLFQNQVSNFKGPAQCCRTSVHGTVQVLRSADGAIAFSGRAACRRSNCIYCCFGTQRKRSAQWIRLLQKASRAGYSVYFLVLTIRTGKLTNEESFDALTAAFQRFICSKQRRKYGILHFLRSQEVVYSGMRAHPHLNVALICDPALVPDDLAKELFQRWRSSVIKVSPRSCPGPEGFYLAELPHGDLEKVARYCTKVAQEGTLSFYKSSGKGCSPYQLLCRARAGCEDSLFAFMEWERNVYNRRRYGASKGIERALDVAIAAAGLDEPELVEVASPVFEEFLSLGSQFYRSLLRPGRLSLFVVLCSSPAVSLPDFDIMKKLILVSNQGFVSRAQLGVWLDKLLMRLVATMAPIGNLGLA